jgi:hypothetical protein
LLAIKHLTTKCPYFAILYRQSRWSRPDPLMTNSLCWQVCQQSKQSLISISRSKFRFCSRLQIKPTKQPLSPICGTIRNGVKMKIEPGMNWKQKIVHKQNPKVTTLELFLQFQGTYSGEFASQPRGTSGSGTIFFSESFLNMELCASGWTLSEYWCCNCSRDGKAWQ